MRWNCRQIGQHGVVAAIPEQNENLPNALISDLKLLSTWPHMITETNSTQISAPLALEENAESEILSSPLLSNSTSLKNSHSKYPQKNVASFQPSEQDNSTENLADAIKKNKVSSQSCSQNPRLLRIQRISGSSKVFLEQNSHKTISTHSIGAEKAIFAALCRAIIPLTPLIPQKIAHSLMAIFEHFKKNTSHLPTNRNSSDSLQNSGGATTRQKRRDQLMGDSILNGKKL